LFEFGAHGFLDELTHAHGFLAAEIVHFGELLNGEAHGHFGEHLVGDPEGDFAFATLPVNNGPSGAVEFFGEFFPCHAALVTKEAELFWGDNHPIG